MIETISALLDIGEKSPPAIDYFYMEPHPQWVPDVALKKAHQNRAFFLAVLTLQNLSAKVLPPVRIKLPCTPQFTPVIEVPSGTGFTYEESVAQIFIDRIDPGDKVYVFIFLSKQEREGFAEPQVLVGDRLLSRGMRTVGYFRKHPKHFLALASAVLGILVALAIPLYAVYKVSPLNPEIRALHEATEHLASAGCLPKAYPHAEVNETLLDRHVMGEPFLLRLNKVGYRKDLFSKEWVVICERRTSD